MTFASIKAAINAWVSGASGITAYWAGQPNMPAQARPCIEMQIDMVRGIGQDWRDSEFDEDGEAGEEITLYSRGVRTGQLTLTCYGAPTEVANSDTSPLARLEDVLAKANLLTYCNALDEAGIGLGQADPVRQIGTRENAAYFEPRAFVSVQLHLTSELSEKTTYIEHVEHEGTVTSFGEDD